MIHDTTVTDRERDFGQVWDLLTATCRPPADGAAPRVNVWSSCRFESWLVFSAPHDPSALDDKLHLWKTADGDLVGLAIVEGFGHDFHVVSCPAIPDIAPAIVTWVEHTWPSEGDQWVTYADADDAPRQATLAGLGYRAEAPSETMHTYDLERLALTPKLPPGFTYSSAAEDDDLVGRSQLISRIFHPERSAKSAPPPVMQEKRSYDPELDLVVRTPGGRMVATAAGFINSKSHIAEVEPVGTHPAFRRRGLALALVTEVFRRLHERGIRWVHIASEPEPAISNRLYQALGPVDHQHFVRWVKWQQQVISSKG